MSAAPGIVLLLFVGGVDPIALLPGDRTVVVALLVAIGAMMALTALFVVVAVTFRVGNRNKASYWKKLETRWEPVIVEVLAEVREPEALTRLVSPGEELYFIDFLYRYARRLRGRDREILCGLARPYLPGLVGRLTGGDPERRARAVQTLSVLGLEEHWTEIVRSLDDPSPLVSMIAARAISRREHPESAKPVLARLHLYQAWSPRFLAAMLANIGPDAAPALRQTLADVSAGLETRAVAADALRKLNDYSAADVAVQVLRAESDPDLLAAALRLLRAVGRPLHLEAVRPFLTSPNFAVRAQAMGVLGRLGAPEDQAPLREGLDDPSPWVAIQAARGLRDMGQSELLQTLVSRSHSRADFALQILTERG